MGEAVDGAGGEGAAGEGCIIPQHGQACTAQGAPRAAAVAGTPLRVPACLLPARPPPTASSVLFMAGATKPPVRLRGSLSWRLRILGAPPSPPSPALPPPSPANAGGGGAPAAVSLTAAAPAVVSAVASALALAVASAVLLAVTFAGGGGGGGGGGGTASHTSTVASAHAAAGRWAAGGRRRACQRRPAKQRLHAGSPAGRPRHHHHPHTPPQPHAHTPPQPRTHTHTHTHTTPHHPPARSTWNTPLVSTLVWMLTLPADTRVEGGRGGAGEGRGGAARWAGGRQRAGAWLAGGGTRAAGLRPAQTEASRPAALTTPRQAAATRAHDPPPLLQRRALPSPESLYRAATSAMPDTLKAPSGKARRQQGMAPAGRAAQQRARGSVLDCGGGGGGGGGRHAAPQGRSRAGLMPRECSVHNPPPFPSRSAFTPSHTHTHTHTTRTIHAHRPPSPGALSKCRVNASESAVRLCRCTARLVGMRRMAGTSTRGPPGQAGREKGVAGGAGARA